MSKILQEPIVLNKPQLVIGEDVSLAKKEVFKDLSYVPVKIDAQTKVRPSPRKPKFLNESTDFSRNNSNQLSSLKKPEICEISLKNHSNVSNALLLPPSAFGLALEEDNGEREANLNSSLSTIDQSEMNMELKHLISYHDASTSQRSLEETKSAEKRDPSCIKKPNTENELVELKRRLEDLSKKSNKLK